MPFHPRALQVGSRRRGFIGKASQPESIVPLDHTIAQSYHYCYRKSAGGSFRSPSFLSLLAWVPRCCRELQKERERERGRERNREKQGVLSSLSFAVFSLAFAGPTLYWSSSLPLVASLSLYVVPIVLAHESSCLAVQSLSEGCTSSLVGRDFGDCGCFAANLLLVGTWASYDLSSGRILEGFSG